MLSRKPEPTHDGSVCMDCREPIKGVVVNGEMVKANLDGTVHECKGTSRKERTRAAMLNFLEKEGKR